MAISSSRPFHWALSLHRWTLVPVVLGLGISTGVNIQKDSPLAKVISVAALLLILVYTLLGVSGLYFSFQGRSKKKNIPGPLMIANGLFVLVWGILLLVPITRNGLFLNLFFGMIALHSITSAILWFFNKEKI